MKTDTLKKETGWEVWSCFVSFISCPHQLLLHPCPFSESFSFFVIFQAVRRDVDSLLTTFRGAGEPVNFTATPPTLCLPGTCAVGQTVTTQVVLENTSTCATAFWFGAPLMDVQDGAGSSPASRSGGALALPPSPPGTPAVSAATAAGAGVVSLPGMPTLLDRQRHCSVSVEPSCGDLAPCGHKGSQVTVTVSVTPWRVGRCDLSVPCVCLGGVFAPRPLPSAAATAQFLGVRPDRVSSVPKRIVLAKLMEQDAFLRSNAAASAPRDGGAAWRALGPPLHGVPLRVGLEAAGARLQFLQPEVDLGLVAVMGNIQAPLSFTNLGPVPLQWQLSSIGPGGLAPPAVTFPDTRRLQRAHEANPPLAPHAVLAFNPPRGLLQPGEVANVDCVCAAGTQPERLRATLQCATSAAFDLDGGGSSNRSGSDATVSAFEPQFVSIRGEVQAPKVYLSVSELNLGGCYVGVPVTRTLVLKNLSNLATHFGWSRCLGDQATGFHFSFSPSAGTLSEKQSLEITFTLVAKTPGVLSEFFACECFGMVLPLGFELKATCRGVVVAYEPIAKGAIPPRPLGSPQDPQYTGKDPLPAQLPRPPQFNFGDSVPLFERRTMQFAIRNFSAIASPFTLKPTRYPVPASTTPTTAAAAAGFGDKSLSDSRFGGGAGVSARGGTAADRAGGTAHRRDSTSRGALSRGGSSSHGGDGREKQPQKRWLDNAHEPRAVYQSEMGKAHVAQRLDAKEDQGVLGAGNGAAFAVFPSSGVLPPWGVVAVTVSAFNEMPGVYLDELECVLEGAPLVKLNLKLKVDGCPLKLVEEGVGVDAKSDPTGRPWLRFGDVLEGSADMVKTVRIRNDGPVGARVTWSVKEPLPEDADAELLERNARLVDVGLAVAPLNAENTEKGPYGKKRRAQPVVLSLTWREKEPYDPPFTVNPPVATLGPHSDAKFEVTLRHQALQSAAVVATEAANESSLDATQAVGLLENGGESGQTDQEKATAAASAGGKKEAAVEAAKLELVRAVMALDAEWQFPESHGQAASTSKQVGNEGSVALGGSIDSGSGSGSSSSSGSTSQSSSSSSSSTAAGKKKKKKSGAGTEQGLDQETLGAVQVQLEAKPTIPRLTVDKQAHVDQGGEQYLKFVAQASQILGLGQLAAQAQALEPGGRGPVEVKALQRSEAASSLAASVAAAQSDWAARPGGPARSLQPMRNSLSGVAAADFSATATTTAVDQGGIGGGSRPSTGAAAAGTAKEPELSQLRSVVLTNPLGMPLTFAVSTTEPFRVVGAKCLAPPHPLSASFAGRLASPPGRAAIAAESAGLQKSGLGALVAGGIFTLPPQEAVTLYVAYAPDSSRKSLKRQGNVRLKDQDKGLLVCQFATGQSQRVELVGVVARPLVVVAPALHNFGLVHTELSSAATLYLSNPTDVAAAWRVTHVPVPPAKLPAAPIDFAAQPSANTVAFTEATAPARPDEALVAPEDDPDAFSFSEHFGVLLGPSLPLSDAAAALPNDVNQLRKPAFPSASESTRVAWKSGQVDLTASLCARNDENFRAPRPLVVTFRPKHARAYQSRFRVEVEKGESFDVVLSGKGTYAENTVAAKPPDVGPKIYSGY